MPDRAQQEPFSIAESAIALHEFHTSLIDAGFTTDQALYLTAQIILANKGQA